jgi:hypothetical protein
MPSLLNQIPLEAVQASNTPVTAMIRIPDVEGVKNLSNPSTEEGRIWSKILTLFQNQPSVTRVYWGTRLEEVGNVDLHVVRRTLDEHKKFLASSAHTEFEKLAHELTPGGEIITRHAYLHNMTANSRALTDAPFTGTAIYIGIDSHCWDPAWALWSTIVPTWKGCEGVSGGYIIDDIEGHGECKAYIAWVGWETTEAHDELHHAQFFKDRRIILQQGHKGYREYGHVVWHKANQKPKASL